MTDGQKSTSRSDVGAKGFTAEEKAAMRERAKEVKAAKSRGSKADGETDLLSKLAEMTGNDRAMGERIHALIKEHAPMLEPRTWYGMPAYAKDGKILCFYQPASKFKARYATLGFDEAAHLDDGSMWATSYALTELTKANEDRIVELVKQAVG